MSNPPLHYEERFIVRSYEVEPDGRLRLVALLRILQEAAWQHAHILGKGFAEREEGAYFWVLSRLRLRIDRYPEWGEPFTVRTFPVGTRKLLALREFTILGAASGAASGAKDAPNAPNSAEEAVIGRAMSAWLIVDGGTGRPVRPQPLVDDLELTPPSYEVDTDRLPSIDEEPLIPDGPHRVRHHDIDQYGHVNNASYLEWIVDSLSARGAWSPPTEVSIDFMSEMLPGDSYFVDVSRVDARIRRASDGRVAVRAAMHDVAPGRSG